MARKVTDTPEMKLRPVRSEKALFVRAAEAARQSLSQWAIQACLERAERQGIAQAESAPKKGSRK